MLHRDEPWQLRMFSKSLKKNQKLDLLLSQIGDTRGKRCLLITNGDNVGALNYKFRLHGGDWVWVENESNHIEEIEELLEERVLKGEPDMIPVDDRSCDVVVSIDVHEHLANCELFNRELFRVTRPEGLVVVTTPNGDPRKTLTRLKNWMGMTKERYGHEVIGFTIAQHGEMLQKVGFEPIVAGSYSRFFTELIELVINFGYVMVLSKKSGQGPRDGKIAPSSAAELRTLGKQYRLYTAIFPLLLSISKLDWLLRPTTGYAVSVAARRPD